jgi:hypothetical protein
MATIVTTHRVLTVKESLDDVRKMITDGWEFLSLTEKCTFYFEFSKEVKPPEVGFYPITINSKFIVEMKD